MATHHCVSSPCWICYPEFAPKHLDNFTAPTHEVSTSVKELLLEIFQEGLNEDAYFRNSEESTIIDLKKELSLLPSDSLAAKLINLIIEDLSRKGSY